MLKRISKRKLCISSAALFAIILMYLFPTNNANLHIKEELKYVESQTLSTPIFLMDKNSYVALTEARVAENNIEKKARELIKILTVGGMDSKVPSGFSAIIPPDTEILNISYDHNVLKINFSKDILDIDEKLEEKMIEAIVYTLTSIEKVDKIIIYVEGDILTKLPKTKINLPSTLDRSFGINKEFDLTNTKNIKDVTVYYINQINENYYYVPVTKYLNDERDKINIIIDELTINFNPNKHLKSFLNNDIKLISSTIEERKIKLELKNENDITNEEITSNINKTISLSICDNYDIDEIFLNTEKKTCKNAKIK
ncbi:MAG: GerMN domain-containing protein [Bacilli bacterium]|nr:GerMN domain-containing protein [Bacilli bacterium]